MAERRHVGGAGHQTEPDIDILRGQAAALGGGLIVLRNQIEPALQRLVAGLENGDRNAGIGEAHGDAAAHGAAADDACALDVARLHVLRQVGDLGGFALGEEDMTLRLRLLAVLQFEEGVALANERVGDRHVEGPAQSLDRLGRRMQSARAFQIGRGHLVEFRRIGAQLVRAFPRARARGRAAFWSRPHSSQMQSRPAADRRRRFRRPAHGFQRIVGIDRIAGQDHGHRLVHADQPRQPLGAAGARHQAELDLGQAEPRARRRDPEMAAERDFEAAAERGAVQGRHHRLRHRVDDFDHVDGGRRHRRLVELGDVGAGNEGAAGRSDHHRLDFLVLARALQRFDQTLAHRDIERVDGRMIDGDDRDRPLAAILDCFRHGEILEFCGMFRKGGRQCQTAAMRRSLRAKRILRLPLWPWHASFRARGSMKGNPVTSATDKTRIEVALGNRILANEGVLDAFGHVSIRNPENPNRYFLSRSRSPELVEPGDVLEYDLDSNPVKPDQGAALCRAGHSRRNLQGAAGRDVDRASSRAGDDAVLHRRCRASAGDASRRDRRPQGADVGSI